MSQIEAKKNVQWSRRIEKSIRFKLMKCCRLLNARLKNNEGSCYRCDLMSCCRLLVISRDVEEVVVGTPLSPVALLLVKQLFTHSEHTRTIFPQGFQAMSFKRLSSCYICILVIANLSQYICFDLYKSKTSHSHYLTSTLLKSAGTEECCPPPENGVGGKITSRLTLDIRGPVTAEELSNQNLVKIVNLECSDLECDHLAWKCLGYKYDENLKAFVLSSDVFPKWAAKYPEAPDLIGIARNYSPEIDKPVRDASMNLMRSIPRDYKGGVRALESEGFRGYKLKELTPNKTRRAQMVNWIIYYREKLWGKTVEQLREERLQEVKQNEDVANLPSEKQYQKLRLDTE